MDENITNSTLHYVTYDMDFDKGVYSLEINQSDAARVHTVPERVLFVLYWRHKNCTEDSTS